MTQQIATRARFGILVMVTIATMINYLDRTVLSVATPALRSELQIDAATMGFVLSAFSWTYAAAQIPGGIILDRIGVRITYALSLVLWSLFTMFQGLATGLTSLLGMRLGLGVAEAPCFPCNSRILSSWFPQAERARANSVYSVGQYLGLGLMSWLLYWITARFGWRALFILVGALGVVFGWIWWLKYRDPGEDARANAAELDYIKAGGGLSFSGVKTTFKWSHIVFLLRQRQMVGAALGQFCGNATLVFFLTWFPSYLATERHMAWIKAGFYASLPFIAASVGVLFGGQLSDYLLKRTGSANLGRKLPVVAGLLLASCIVGANYVDSDGLVIAIMSVAFFGQGMVNLGWTLLTDIAPRKLFGLAGGVFNLSANLAGIVTPIVVGQIVQRTGSFKAALAFIATLAVIGVLSYLLILGDVKRVQYDDA
jgi:ACS family D-galactonate transporter-like MFS transporter